MPAACGGKNDTQLVSTMCLLIAGQGFYLMQPAFCRLHNIIRINKNTGGNTMSKTKNTKSALLMSFTSLL
ncbi:MAG: hypothetical protein PUC93_00620, partial [Oscillospiraceae bacterium]|nr:hypothetical protein [Oscillospiraceae bacterium]